MSDEQDDRSYAQRKLEEYSKLSRETGVVKAIFGNWSSDKVLLEDGRRVLRRYLRYERPLQIGSKVDFPTRYALPPREQPKPINNEEGD